MTFQEIGIEKNEDKVGTKNMTSEIYADGKRKKIDDEILNTADTLRKCIKIKAFTSCRFLLS